MTAPEPDDNTAFTVRIAAALDAARADEAARWQAKIEALDILIRGQQSTIAAQEAEVDRLRALLDGER